MWILSWNLINIFKFQICPPPPKKKMGGHTQEFYHSFMYIAPSSGHSLLNLEVHFKLILRRFDVTFWCLERVCYRYLWKLGEIHSNPRILHVYEDEKFIGCVDTSLGWLKGVAPQQWNLACIKFNLSWY